MTNSSECRVSKIRLKYSTRPARPAARQAGTGRGRSRVSAPVPAAVITAPVAMTNHSAPINSGASTTEASTQAIAAMIVILRSAATTDPLVRQPHLVL